jgi:sugar phosphate isomerase/epimerase
LKLGLSTWCFLRSDVYSAIRTVDDAGVDFVEIWGETPHASLEWVDRTRLKDALSTTNLTATMHAPFTDLNLGATTQPVRSAIRKSLEEFVDMALYVNAKTVTFHPGSTNYSGLLDVANENSLKSISELLDHGKGAITLNIENQAASTSPYYIPLCRSVQSVEAFLSAVDGVGLTLDTGHAHISQIDPGEFYSRLKPRISEIHLNDNDGAFDDHLMPGAGKVPLKTLYSAIAGEDVDVCLELNPFKLSPEEVLAAVEATRRDLSQPPT